ncbi:DUF2829 domain-containing protein [Pediococcus pentosaceus]|jgi:hypothetical protein|uniref:DUF2829 domain-containing protein n=1 Tax=Pediococcus pentosaceus CGMCC 7049 TaxID=1460385 RepID=A0AAU7NNJ0_PEDPE|nr:DUF2829 domain-containing protein [Pediococcus pentosaceus]KRN49055.1 hypothetical protein IV86_GL000634 [Pediococcus pentosaceus]MBM9929095.1 DUF2829 domain-containing protein [Pediococcus pentosaceus]MCE5960423.1 DUF2829 domain-containing protein [Pediococcus pentosaceus]MCG7196468.1 DUF2829 domain-containing protein [Pediococcus pentosaceus]MCH4098762.1 DUF2829 domain-containing protein [Pediococcus pentosaceus]
MTFEKILPILKNNGKAIREQWDGDEEFILVVKDQKFNNIPITPYMLIKTTSEGYSSFAPTVCDVLADDWKVVD